MQLRPILIPVHEAFGRYLGDFHRDYFEPDTAANAEWAARELKQAIAFVPGRMIDAAEDMLAAWRRNDNTGKAGTSAYLPVILLALDKTWTPVPGDYSRQASERIPFSFPEDPLQRVFHVRVAQGEIRAQAAIFAAEAMSAGSLAAQLALFAQDMPRRKFLATYRFAGFESQWPVQLQTNDPAAVSYPGEQTNLTILTVDFTLRASMPIFTAPRGTEPTDGKGVPGDANNPPGFAVTQDFTLSASARAGAELIGAPVVVLHALQDATGGEQANTPEET